MDKHKAEVKNRRKTVISFSSVHKLKYWECCYFFDPGYAIVIVNFCDKQESVQRTAR